PSSGTSEGRKPSTIESVRLPWATVVPKGLSRFARSGSTWIHWRSPETAAKASMSPCVTVRHSPGPSSRPTRSLTPSIPGASAAGIPISLASAAPPAGEQLAVAVAAGAEDEVLDPLLPGLDAAGDRGRDADRVQLRQLDHVAVEVDPAAAPDHHVD